MSSNPQITTDISTKAILTEAWQKVHGNKQTICFAALVYTLSHFVVLSVTKGAIAYLLFPILRLSVLDAVYFIPLIILLLGLISSFMLWPMLAGILMMGVHCSKKLPIKLSMIFKYYSLKLSATYLIIFFLLQTVAWIFFMQTVTWVFLMWLTRLTSIITMILSAYITISYSLVTPLLIEKKLSIWASLEASRKTIAKHYWKVLGLAVSLLFIYLIGVMPVFIALDPSLSVARLAFPLGITLIWSVPLSVIAYGTLYQKLFD